MAILRKLGQVGKSVVKATLGGAKAIARRLPAIGTAVGVAYAGKKLLDNADQIQSLQSDVAEAQDTAQQVQQEVSNVSGVRSGAQAVRNIQEEVKEAKQYRDTRKESLKRGIQMDSRPEYKAKAAASAKAQASEVKLVGKASCMAKASKLAGRKRKKAVKKCNQKYPE